MEDNRKCADDAAVMRSIEKFAQEWGFLMSRENLHCDPEKYYIYVEWIKSDKLVAFIERPRKMNGYWNWEIVAIASVDDWEEFRPYKMYKRLVSEATRAGLTTTKINSMEKI
jgi:hypothetical protein